MALCILCESRWFFLANNFCAGPVFLACSDTADLRSFCVVWTRPREFIWNGFSCIETTLYSFYLIIKCESYPLDLSTVHTVFCKCNIPSYQCSSVFAKINMWIKQYSKLRLDYQPLFGKMSPHSSPFFGEDQRLDPGDGGNWAYSKLSS